MPKKQSKEPYEGFTDDVKEIKNYFKYLYIKFTCGGDPHLVRNFARYIREWKADEGISY